MTYAHKEEALGDVRARAAEYFDERVAAELAHDRLARAIRVAKADFPRITQEELAAQTDFSDVRDDAKLSRQRVQQILAETP